LLLLRDSRYRYGRSQHVLLLCIEASVTPAPTLMPCSRLAELMLPDGAHLRAEDWTVFYLGQTSSSAVDPILEQHSPTLNTKQTNNSSLSIPETVTGRRKSFVANDGKPREGIAGNGLLYVLNVVKMKEDSSMRRGAQVKAMALCSPYPYIGIFKVSQILMRSISGHSSYCIGRLAPGCQRVLCQSVLRDP
jgi:hypothetical protein